MKKLLIAITLLCLCFLYTFGQSGRKNTTTIIHLDETKIVTVKEPKEKLGNDQLNGSYISVGSSMFSSGLYGGILGMSYEYRYKIIGINASVGAGWDAWQGGHYCNSENLSSGEPYLNANLGIKFYLSAGEKPGLRNLYFNVMPLCYFGQYETHSSRIVSKGESIYWVDDYKHPHLIGAGLFFGYSPIWHVNKKVGLGFNVALGTKVNYKFNEWRYINGDLGFMIKF